MDRILGANYVIVGGQRQFINKNLGASIPGTTFDQEWQNGVQEALVRPLEAVGITPVASNFDQNTQLMAITAGGNISVATGNTALSVAQSGIVLVNVAANATITLPSANAIAAVGGHFEFIRIDDTGATVTIAFQTGDTWYPGTTSISSLPSGQKARLFAFTGSPNGNWLNMTDAPAGVQVFTANGTFTAQVPLIFVSAIAGGGGGASSYTDSTSQYSGGGGAMGQNALEYALTVTVGATYNIGIGAGGAGGASGSGGNNGAAGSPTSFDTLLTLSGGAGGSKGSPITTQALGGVASNLSQINGGDGGLIPISQVGNITMPGGASSGTPFGGYGAGGRGSPLYAGVTTFSGNPGNAGYLRVRW